ncbi:DUF4255 domain-containing protein [Aureitalea sp. L0-47]|uniref:DUF4255 domain-containing protein n=1 Tax=Aureitalea sp. L0-47 TaxID=2816962 RepID=UPI002238D864|nr:DUF4255 domain-containing protein [Aureitalea sp. L0-47]MCW5519044.1 DUF4255 domain-containing protein [Aureitalea sp. L0-47]
MISKAIGFLTEFLNRHLKLTCGLDHDIVVASNLVNPDGSITENIQDKIVVSVINMEQETYMKSHNHYMTDGGDSFRKAAPPVHLNIHLLISANYNSKKYLEALKMLSSVITTLQSYPFFIKQEHPDMQDPLSKLTLEFMNLPVNELSNIWNGIGTKYVPSILYKMRIITLEDTKMRKEIPGITGLEGETES